MHSDFKIFNAANTTIVWKLLSLKFVKIKILSAIEAKYYLPTCQQTSLKYTK